MRNRVSSMLSLLFVFFVYVSFLFSFPLVSAGKRSDAPKPTYKPGEPPSKFEKRLARWWSHQGDDCPPEMRASAEKHNKVAGHSLTTAKQVSKSNSALLTIGQKHTLASNRIVQDNSKAELKESRRVRNSNPFALTERQIMRLASGDALNAEETEARRVRNVNPSLMTERQINLLASNDASIAEISEARRVRNFNPSGLTDRQIMRLASRDAFTARRARERARLGRISQAAWLGADLLVHSEQEIASILEHIRQVTNLYLASHPFAAFYIGSVSYDLSEYVTLSLEQLIHRQIIADGQCILEGGRSGSYDPILRYNILGRFMTIREFIAMGGVLHIVHYTLNPSDNGVERALQLLHRRFNPDLSQGAVMNGGSHASGNLWTQEGRICQTGILVLPNRTNCERFPGGIHAPWPANLSELTPASLGPTADPMPVRAVPHVGEAFLHMHSNATQMRAKVVADVMGLLRNRGPSTPLIAESWDGRIRPGTRVSNIGHHFASNPRLSTAMAGLDIVNVANNHLNADVIVVSDGMFSGNEVPSASAIDAKSRGMQVASLTSFTRAIFEATEGYDDDDDVNNDDDDIDGDLGGIPRTPLLSSSSSITVSGLDSISGYSSSSPPSTFGVKAKKRKLPTFTIGRPVHVSDEERDRQIALMPEVDITFDEDDDPIDAPMPPSINSSFVTAENADLYHNSHHTEAFEQPPGPSVDSSLPVSTTSSTSSLSSSTQLESTSVFTLMDGKAISAFFKSTKPNRGPSNAPLFRYPTVEVVPFVESFTIDAFGSTFNPIPQEPRRGLKRPADHLENDEDDDDDDLTLAVRKTSK